jgi:hypothetical protein
MTTAAKAKGLHAKLAEVMAEVERIPKNGTAPPAMGGFKFVQVGDAADVIRKALGDRQVSMLPSAVEVIGEREHETQSKKVMTTLTIRQTWTLTDAETGESATIQSIGAGADTGDKSAPKAMTAGMKYAILTGFLMSTGDDPEMTDTSDRQTRPEPQLAGDEQVTLIGVDTLTGDVKKGDAARYRADWRETPDGPVIGFALKRKGDKDFPQVGVMGNIARALFATGDFPTGAELVGQHISLKGRFYAVRAVLDDGSLGRAYTRVIVGQSDKDYIEVGDWRIPPATEANPEGVQPLRDPEQDVIPVAEGQVGFDLVESARLDAEEAARA